MPIKVIDLFAGPGGLGEGFSAYRPNGKQEFKIAISIEKEDSAHRTLQLRSLFRQFEIEDVPEEYYAFLRGELGKQPEDELYELPDLQEALVLAKHEAQKITLGEEDNKVVFKKISDAVGKDPCILIGGPPCQAYSLVGRSRNFGAKDKKYSASEDHRNFLYKEYLKIIAKFQPEVFVMENVKGLLSAKVDGHLIFESIYKDLQEPCKFSGEKALGRKKENKYNIYSLVTETDENNIDPHEFIIRTENYGLPQARHRVILLGIRDDIAVSVGDFKRLKKIEKSKDRATVKKVISDLPKLRSKLSKGIDTPDNWRETISSIDKQTLKNLEKSKHVPDEVYNNFTHYLKNIWNSPTDTGKDKGCKKRTKYNRYLPESLKEWYQDKNLKNYVINHESRGHISSDLHRYLYYATYAEEIGVSPKSNNLPKVLWPEHKNFESGKFADRFRVQGAETHGTTVTSHISKDGHYFIHYDPSQCRSLTVREAARIQTFPDNYYFVGNRTQQYVQVGNAVPPYLAKQIAGIVFKIIKAV